MIAAPLSQRGYAARRRARGLPGGSRESVRRAIETGRLSGSLTPDRKGIADPDLADREWEASTLADRRPPPVPAAGRAAAGGPAPPLELPAGIPPLAESRARQAAAAAELAERRLAEHAGKFIDVDEARADVIAAYTIARTRLLGIPSRLRQRGATISAGDLALLDELLRDALEELADADADADADARASATDY